MNHTGEISVPTWVLGIELIIKSSANDPVQPIPPPKTSVQPFKLLLSPLNSISFELIKILNN